ATQGATVNPAEKVLAVFAGAANVFIVRANGSILAAGDNHAGQLGSASNTSQGAAEQDRRAAFTAVYGDTNAPFTDAVAVAAGESHAVIMRQDGSLWGAGSSAFGELGRQGGNLAAFTRLSAAGTPISNATAVAAGNNSTFFIDTDNRLWASGSNRYGELGLENHSVHFSFMEVESAGSGVVAIASGLRHTALLKDDGTLWVSGSNFEGQLGLGDTDDRASFTLVSDIGSDIIAIAAGNHHTVILKDDGSVWGAGSNFWGQLGVADSGGELAFTRLHDANGNPLADISRIAARGDLTALVTANDTIFLTGNYFDPQSMLDITASGKSPDIRHAFAPLLTERRKGLDFGEIQSIAMGHTSVYIIDSNGRLWAAGSNRYGQLALGFTTDISLVLRAISP
ncbi:MAG: hypothetical protein FWD91_05545, partial [Treponema sp.]|nr:hypothetical protein [Treponema sp.]